MSQLLAGARRSLVTATLLRPKLGVLVIPQITRLNPDTHPENTLCLCCTRPQEWYDKPEVIESSLFQWLDSFSCLGTIENAKWAALAAKVDEYLPGLAYLNTPRGIFYCWEDLQKKWVSAGSSCHWNSTALDWLRHCASGSETSSPTDLQMVRVGDRKSSTLILNIGTPQWCVLSPNPNPNPNLTPSSLHPVHSWLLCQLSRKHDGEVCSWYQGRGSYIKRWWGQLQRGDPAPDRVVLRQQPCPEHQQDQRGPCGHPGP